uniref:Uncharacterized protein n=1 Tax=Caenorhabditis japonica TaxID=281687 RepID=A0A8R1IJL3_CAEJA
MPNPCSVPSVFKRKATPSDVDLTKSEKRSKRTAMETRQTTGSENPDEIQENTFPISSASVKRPKCSENDEWIPAGFMQNSCYTHTGVLLSKSQCINIEKALKSRKPVDFYEVLKLADHEEIKNTAVVEIAQTAAFLAYKLNKLENKSKSVPEVQKQQSKIFDFEKARAEDVETYLPGGKPLLFTALLTETLMSRCVGKDQTKALEKAVITVFDEIHSRDPWFLIYTVPESTRATQFPKVDTHFFDTLAKVLQAGFSIDETSWSLSKIVSHIKSSLRNYIDPVFRSTEFFVHESQPNYYQPSSSTEQSVEPEEPVVIPENDMSIEKTVDVVADEYTYY